MCKMISLVRDRQRTGKPIGLEFVLHRERSTPIKDYVELARIDCILLITPISNNRAEITKQKERIEINSLSSRAQFYKM